MASRVNLFQRLLGSWRHQGVKSSSASFQPATSTLQPLKDADYEYLFVQLLEGVAHGWQQARLMHFFEALGERSNTELWIDWLRRFGERLLASATVNKDIAARMVQLGEVGCGEIGEVAYEIGMQLLRARRTSMGI
ncbi:MAG: hypothetical protein NVS2B14_22130 [Chamaesiphon sp.]